MVSMINLSAGFDPYKDYTSILKKSAHIKTEEELFTEKQIKPNEFLEDNARKTEASKSAVAAFKAEVPIADISDISESLRGIQDFSFIGRDSDINLLDADKAVSDLRKDDILSEYQYFVGNSEQFN